MYTVDKTVTYTCILKDIPSNLIYWLHCSDIFPDINEFDLCYDTFTTSNKAIIPATVNKLMLFEGITCTEDGYTYDIVYDEMIQPSANLRKLYDNRDIYTMQPALKQLLIKHFEG